MTDTFFSALYPFSIYGIITIGGIVTGSTDPGLVGKGISEVVEHMDAISFHKPNDRNIKTD